MAKGGMSDMTAGGGGAGGRIAVYHDSRPSIPPYRGDYHVQGGSGNPLTGAEAGASGTVLITNTSSGHVTLKVNNEGQPQIAEDTSILNEGRRLDLSMAYGSYSRSQSYTSKEGHTIETTGQIMQRVYHWQDQCNFYVDSRSYLVMNMFDQTLKNEKHQYYLADASSFTLTITLTGTKFINRIKIYPTVEYPSQFKVWEVFS